MNYVYYIKKTMQSQYLIEKILQNYYDIADAEFYRNENGKPYLKGNRLFFNLTNTRDFTAVAVSEKEIGLDAERLDRKVNFDRFFKSFSLAERQEMKTPLDFFKNWTAKESLVKYYGASLAAYLKRLEYANGEMLLDGQKIKETIIHTKIDGVLLAVCSSNKDCHFIEISL